MNDFIELQLNIRLALAVPRDLAMQHPWLISNATASEIVKLLKNDLGVGAAIVLKNIVCTPTERSEFKGDF